MKKALLALAAVALLFATSCKKESINPAVDVPEGSFLATIDNGANPQNAPRINDGMGTMTTIDGNRYVIWESGDQISINNSIYTTNTAGNSVVFSGGNATGPKYHAFYPATIAGTGAAGTLPATQVIISDIATGANKVSNLPMYANSESNQLTFENICAALKVNVPIACDSIVVSAHQPICGNFAIAYDETKPYADMATAAATDTIITVIKEQSGSFAATEIAYVAIPAGTYTNFIVKFYAGESIVSQKTLASLTVEVNKVYNVRFPQELCFTAQETTTIGMTAVGSSAPDVELEYSVYDASAKTNSTWEPFTVGTTSVSLDPGDKVYFKASARGNDYFLEDGSNYYYFTSTGNVTVSGNIMYLLSQTPATTLTSSNRCAFAYLFKDMKNLTDASELILPATTLSADCYSAMFQNCSSLTAAPALPAETLAVRCYSNLFNGCTSLMAAPALPAETLAYSCYFCMFNRCSRLTAAPALPAETLAKLCYMNMFSFCSSLMEAPDLPAKTLADKCYDTMFDHCTNLKKAPDLPATTLADSCYNQMFSFCSSLTEAPDLPVETLANSCYQNMFFYCTSLTEAPELSAETLADNCYNMMFFGCSKLGTVTMKATTISNTNSLQNWLVAAGTSATSQTIHINSTLSNTTGTAGATITANTPSDWTISNGTTSWAGGTSPTPPSTSIRRK